MPEIRSLLKSGAAPTILQAVEDAQDAKTAAEAAAAEAALYDGPWLDTVAALLTNTTLTYANTPVGTIVRTRAEGFAYKVAASGATDQHVTTAGGVKLYVLPGADGFRNANAFGSTNAAWQVAVELGGKIRFDGAYTIATSLAIGQSITLDLERATFTGPSATGAVDAFFCNSATINISARGGNFTGFRFGFAIRRALNVDIDRITVSDCAAGVGVNVIANSSFTSAGKFSVRNSRFDSVELGTIVQSCQFSVVEFSNNFCTNLGDKSVGVRVYPLDKRIVSGFWYQSLAGASFASVTNNYVSGVTAFSVAPAEPEVHGLAVSLDNASSTEVVMLGNTVENVTGASAEGIEGIMGRGRRVIVSNNILVDAGMREGMIYAKGSTYHKISGNTIECTGTPDSLTRGIISTGQFADITGNKIINVPNPIWSRAPQLMIQNNELYGCGQITNVVTDQPHIRTIVQNNYADDTCPANFVSLSLVGTATSGEIIITDNKLFNRGRSVSFPGATRFVFTGNYVRRTTPTTQRELIVSGGVSQITIIKGNQFLGFNDGNGPSEGRILTGSTANTPRIFFEENHVEGGATALWLRDQTYVDLVIRNNCFFACTPRNVTSITVTGKNVTEGNVGIDL